MMMHDIKAFVRRVKRLLVKNSMKKSIQIILSKPFNEIQNLTSSKRVEQALPSEVDQIFDIAHNTNTGGCIPLYNFEIDSENWIYGNDYKPIDNVEFENIFNGLNITFEKFFFIDLGSGKGRALLLASKYTFKKIIGVEFCQDLNCTAQKNISSYPRDDLICNDIETICMDACEYCFPDAPLVLFMFNPFQTPIMKKIIENLKVSYSKHKRRFIVIYYNPVYGYLWDNVAFLERVNTETKYHIYDTIADDE